MGIRTVTEGARSCLHDCQTPSEPWGEAVTTETTNLIKESRLPISLWGEAAKFTVYTLNRVLSKTSSVTPYQRWHNNPPDVSNLRTFGSIAYIHIPDALRPNWAKKSIRCIFIDYCETTKGWRFYDPSTRTVKISRDVTFDEHHRLVDVPEDPTNNTHPFQRQAPASHAQEKPLPISDPQATAETQHPGKVRDQEQAGNTAETPTQYETPENPEAAQGEQETQVRRSLRGRVPLRE